jgi:hypothetical protein
LTDLELNTVNARVEWAAAEMRTKYGGRAKRRNGPHPRSKHITAPAWGLDEFARKIYRMEMDSISRMARGWRHRVASGSSYARQRRFAEAA